MTDTLVVLAPVAERLEQEAMDARPNECCGMLAGRRSTVTSILPVRNAADDGRSRFEMDPAEMWDARRSIEGDGLECLGFYHSHPRTSPIPSSYDIERAYYPDAVYLIVGLEPRFELRAFRIAAGASTEIPLDIESKER